MTKQRISLGFADALDDFNPDEWTPKEKTTVHIKTLSSNALHEDEKLSPRQISSQSAIAAGFKSREPKKLTADIQEHVTQQRRRRTGRNAQFNLKARPETIAAFCAIADQQEWGLGETLEKAVTLLEHEYKKQ